MKTGFLFLAIVAMGVLASLLTTKMKLPPIIGSAMTCGVVLTMMMAGGAPVGIRDGDFWPDLRGNILGGFIGGAIVGPILYKFGRDPYRQLIHGPKA